MMQFELTNQTARLSSFNPRAELNGDDPKPAADLDFTCNLPSESLALFHETLRHSLYYRNDAIVQDLANDSHEAPNLRYPKLGVLSWKHEMIGATLTIAHGLGGRSDLVLDGCNVKKFRLDPQEGGTVIVSFQVQGHPGERECGKLALMIGQEVEISIEPPEGDLVEQAEKPKRGRKAEAEAAAEV